MTALDEYRLRAAAARQEAAGCSLSQRRALLESSAQRWEEMIALGEQTAARAVVNQQDKVEARAAREELGIVLGRRAAMREAERVL